MFDAMVSHGRLGLPAFVELTSAAPARIYGLATKGVIAPGFDADLVLWDPARKVAYGADDLHDNVGYNPWEGRTVTGWPVRVILRGETIVDDGTWLGTPGTGRWLAREAIGTRPADITGDRP
jgi:dihydropyrimidinase